MAPSAKGTPPEGGTPATGKLTGGPPATRLANRLLGSAARTPAEPSPQDARLRSRTGMLGEGGILSAMTPSPRGAMASLNTRGGTPAEGLISQWATIDVTAHDIEISYAVLIIHI